MTNWKKSLLGSSTMPFGTGGSFTLITPHHHLHHEHAADGSCCGHDHAHHAEEAEAEASSCGHDHAPGESCGG
jgi:hypothetical protein